MSLYAIDKLPEEKKGLVHIMNYTTKDFSMEYLDDKNQAHTITIPAIDTKSFSPELAPLVLTHLANFILNLQGFGYATDPKEEIRKIKEKITIHE